MAVNTHHQGQEFLGERQHVAFITVMCYQQPPGKALLQVMAAIAGRCLHGLAWVRGH